MAQLINLTISNPEVLRDGVRRAAEGIFNEVAFIVEEEGEAAATRIKTEGFGTETGPHTLRNRTGDAYESIGAEFVRDDATYTAVTRFGAVHPPEGIVPLYLRTHETGATITASASEKLAFPPSDAEWPIRDADGAQLFTAVEFISRAEEFGFAYIMFTDGAIIGRREGFREFEVLFIRRDMVTIPPRQPIGIQFQPTKAAIIRRIEALGDKL